jgi:hypothetical protein
MAMMQDCVTDIIAKASGPTTAVKGEIVLEMDFHMHG